MGPLGLSTAGFGFFPRESSGQSASAHHGRFTEWIGVVLILLGPVLVIIAALRFFRTEREIAENVDRRRYGLIRSVVGASVLLGLAFTVYLILTAQKPRIAAQSPSGRRGIRIAHPIESDERRNEGGEHAESPEQIEHVLRAEGERHRDGEEQGEQDAQRAPIRVSWGASPLVT